MRLLRSLRGVIAIIGVARQTISIAQGKHNFRKVWRKRDDAIHFLRNVNFAADFVRQFAACRERGMRCSCLQGAALRRDGPFAQGQQ